MAGHTVVAVFQKIVSVVVVILLSCFDLFAGDVLLQVSNQKSSSLFSTLVSLVRFWFFFNGIYVSSPAALWLVC